MRSTYRLHQQRISGKKQHQAVTVVGLAIAIVLLPITEIFLLQAVSIVSFAMIVWWLGFLQRRIFAVFVLCLLPVIFAPNMIVWGASFEVAKPLFMMAAILALLATEKRLRKKHYELFVLCMSFVFFLFVCFKIFDLDGLISAYRISSQLDSIHLDRFTAPFLFAGDFGLAALYLAFLCLALGGQRNLLFAAFFVFCVFMSQSRLALAGLPAAIFFFRGEGQRIWPLIFALIGGVLIYLYFDTILERLPYVQRFFDEYEHYMTSSKRAEEFFFVFEHWRSIIFSGTQDFVLSRNLTTAESSIVSYMVKVGIVATLMLWIITGYMFLKRLKFGLAQLAILLFFALLAAPLDRPKLSIVIVLCIAGISHAGRHLQALRATRNPHSQLGQRQMTGTASHARPMAFSSQKPT